MAITINWATKVISVPRSDMTLVQSAPVEVRELDLNVFRQALKDLEDAEAGIVFLDTHRHFTEVSLGTLTLARVIEIINGYTVTFEDGQYAVNLVGANSNIMDVLNPNQVSVRSNNSAGLIGAVGGQVLGQRRHRNRDHFPARPAPSAGGSGGDTSGRAAGKHDHYHQERGQRNQKPDHRHGGRIRQPQRTGLRPDGLT